MKYSNIRGTDIKVSQLCLGTSNYGTWLTEKFAIEQLDRFVDYGGNFMDSAHIYGDWIPGERARSEKIFGRWLRARKNRHNLVIIGKGGHPDFDQMDISRVNAKALAEDMNATLENLGTDYVDIYILHRDDVCIPVEELVDTLEGFRREGKTRYYGCSNWTLERLKAAQDYAKRQGYKGFSCNQIMDCLAIPNENVVKNRNLLFLDKVYHDYHEQTKLAVTAYMAITGGYFTKCAMSAHIPESTEELCENAVNRKMSAYLNERIQEPRKIGMYVLRYVMERDYLSVPIASFSNHETLEDAVASCDMKVDLEIINGLRSIRGW
ncbi:aldo/keto reductase [Roseburia hominis]